MKVFKPNFKRTVDGFAGLAIVIVQNLESHEVLMVAFANEEAWLKTLETGMATFFKTSTGKLWTKGETSGNFMKTIDMCVDCDGDAIIYFVEPQGDKLACHTGAVDCFYRNIDVSYGHLSAPKAGPDEELEQIEIDVHPNFLE